MPTENAPQNDSTTHAHAGTIVVLIDQSNAMAVPVAGGTKPKAESVATAVNSMLNQLAAGPDVRLAIVGYGAHSDAAPAAELRWTGPLAGRVFVNSSELAATPTTVEDRVRRIPGIGGVGIAREETIQFPIWYVPQNLGTGSLEQAMAFVQRMLSEQPSDSSEKPPLVLHICGQLPAAAVLRSESVQTSLTTGSWCHLQLGDSDRIPATLYPSSSQHLPGEEAAALFDASCVLPQPLVAALRATQVAATPNARGLVCQANIADLIRFLTLAKAYALCQSAAFPPAVSVQPDDVDATVTGLQTATAILPPLAHTPQTPGISQTYERVALTLLVDRSQADPESGVWRRRQEQVNDILGQIAKRAGGDIEIGLIVYGSGTIDIGFAGTREGTGLVPDVELADAAVRVEQFIEKVSNGIGGLVELKRSRPIFLDGEPSEPATDLEPVTAALAEMLEPIREARAEKRILPLVLHVTGAEFSPETIESAGARFTELGDALVYHILVPETPQRTLAYPDDDRQIDDPRTAAFWQWTSPLAGAELIATRRHTVTKASRGLVVGAKFDLLLDSIQSILPTP